MKIAMIAFGSTGDVRPYSILGRELKRRGHHVTVFATSEFQGMMEKAGLNFHALPGDAKELMGNVMRPDVKGFGFINQFVKSVKTMLDPLLEDLINATADAECIIATFLAHVFSSVAEYHKIPFIQTHYYLMDRNSSAPIAAAPLQRIDSKAWSKATYDIGYLFMNLLEKYYLDNWREEHGLQKLKVQRGPGYELNGHTVPVLYAMSPITMPRPMGWPDNIYMTGYWINDVTTPSDYVPPEDLQAFLDAGEPPVYIGFGSMVSGDMTELMSKVLEGVKLSGVRAILAKGWGEAKLVNDNPNVFLADFVPHDWLFRHVKAVVHHGGAGTLAAGICAGLPTLVVPFGGDQPFWANRVRQMGIGPKPIPRNRLTPKRLAKGLQELVSERRFRVAAKELGLRLAMEDGVANAANIIEHELRKYLREENLPPVLVKTAEM